MTGDTANGRSISVVRTLFPGNLNFAIAQAAATPNATLAGTTIATVSSVSLIEASALGSAIDARKWPAPLAAASAKTTASGSTRKNARKASATAVSSQRAHAGSRVARGEAARAGREGMVLAIADANWCEGRGRFVPC